MGFLTNDEERLKGYGYDQWQSGKSLTWEMRWRAIKRGTIATGVGLVAVWALAQNVGNETKNKQKPDKPVAQGLAHIETCVSGNCENGAGKLTDDGPLGTIVEEGTFVNKKLHEGTISHYNDRGRLQSREEGRFINGFLLHGQGVSMEFRDVNDGVPIRIYTGSFYKGFPHGFVKLKKTTEEREKFGQPPVEVFEGVTEDRSYRLTRPIFKLEPDGTKCEVKFRNHEFQTDWKYVEPCPK